MEKAHLEHQMSVFNVNSQAWKTSGVRPPSSRQRVLTYVSVGPAETHRFKPRLGETATCWVHTASGSRGVTQGCSPLKCVRFSGQAPLCPLASDSLGRHVGSARYEVT